MGYKMKIYETAKKDFGQNAPKLTGVLSSMSSGQFMNCMNDDEQLKLKILEASKLLKDAHKWKGEQMGEMEKERADDKPLFFLPSAKQRYYAVEPGNVSMERLNVFRNVGRIIGLALLHNEICPIPLSRSVVKQILGRKVNWHDLAFYDTDLFESLRKLVHATTQDPNYLTPLDMTFEIVDKDNQTVELIPGGASLRVTEENIHDYVRRYATYKMVTKPAPAIKEIRAGVHDVISETALNGLTPEDWWLLVNGVGTVDVAKLAAMTSFNDESSLSSNDNVVKRFETWFWEVVNSFTQTERQELLYFWTGAPALRAGEEAFEPAPSITIRHPNDQALPSANTCISRLYLHLYSSKAILKAKLSMAIKTKSFGFV